MRTWHFSNFYFFYFATIGVIMPYWAPYLDHMGFTAKEIGQLMAIFLFTKVLAPNFWASVADKLTAKNGGSLGLLKFATLATALIYSAMYWVQSFWSVAVVMLGYCVFWNASLPQLEAATLNHLNDKRQYGRVRLWGSFGFITTVFGLGVLMDYTGPESILTVGYLAMWALFLASLLMRYSPQGLSNSANINADVGNVLTPISRILSVKIVALLVMCSLMQVSHAPLQTFMSLYLSDYGYSHWQIGLLWSTGVAFEIFVFVFAFKILNRFRLSNLLTFTFAASAVRWLLIARFPDVPTIVFLTQAMHAITFGLYHTVMIQLIDRLFVGRYQIRGQALYSSVTFGLGGAIGSFASGYIWQGMGKQELFALCGLMMVVVSVFSFFLTHKLIAENSR